VVGEVVVEGGRVADRLREADPAVHSGQEPVDAGAGAQRRLASLAQRRESHTS
jgi:hypothetical protein